jgi:transcriptional regulator of arginine metabolism
VSVVLTAGPGAKRERQRAIRELVAAYEVTSQGDLAEQLRDRGFPVTQATVSRDIAELGLVKMIRGDRHVYVSSSEIALASGPVPTALSALPAAPSAGEAGTAPGRTPSDDHLRRLVSDIPVQVGRSGLILLLIGAPGTASVLAQAIDDSTMDEQEGTLAGDNTLLVLFRDELRLERWLAKFRSIQDGSATQNDEMPARALGAAPSGRTEAPR